VTSATPPKEQSSSLTNSDKAGRFARFRELSFKQILRWAAWTFLGAVVLWCWMVLGVAALTFFNYLVLLLDPARAFTRFPLAKSSERAYDRSRS